MEEIRILQSSQMGYGNLSQESIAEGLKWKPHVIVGQGTSTDPGPGYLGSDEMYPYVGKINKKRDTGLALVAAKKNGIPFIFSVGAPAGANIHLEWMLRVINEIARENDLKLRIAVISGEILKEYPMRKLERGVRIRRLVETPRLTEYLSRM